MTPAAAAYGAARARARRAGLLSRSTLVVLATAERGSHVLDAWPELATPADPQPLIARAFARLTDDYLAMLRAYPALRDALLALVRLHELENLKLAWRTAGGAPGIVTWQHCWRPLGPLAVISQDIAASPDRRRLVRALTGSVYHAVADSVLRSHADDLPAAELAFDRWGTTRITAARAALPHPERDARALLASVVREREEAMIRRAVTTIGVARSSAARLVRAAPDEGSVTAEAIRAKRLHLCQRVFQGQPFTMALPLALVLLREDEVRALQIASELRALGASVTMARERLAGRS